MKCNKYITEYLQKLKKDYDNINYERKLLINYIEYIFSTEKLYWNDDSIEKYFSYQKYFPYNLYDWEKFIFVLHNCIFKEDGSPRWPDLFLFVGRGAGKNGYESFENFCLLSQNNKIKKYNIDTIATSEEQAKRSFDEVYDILETNKRILQKYWYWNKTVIKNRISKSEWTYKTSNAKTKDGGRPGKVDFDEIHAYENYDNIEVHEGGLGKVDHARTLKMGSDGYFRDGPLDDYKNTSLAILRLEIKDNGLLPFICKLDSIDEIDNEKAWLKANPSLEYDLKLYNQYRKEYIDYKKDPAKKSSFPTKRMNLPQQKNDVVAVKWEYIEATNCEIPDLTNYPCVAGIDYMKTTDFMSAFLLFKVKNIYYGITHTWVCKNSNDLPRIKVPLREWESKGLLTIIDDVEINPEILIMWLQEKNKKYKIRKIALDNYRYTLISEYLKKIGFDANDKDRVKLIRPSDIMRVYPTIDSTFVGGKIKWGDNALMRWAVNNTKVVPTVNNNYKYEKIEPKSRKNDPFMAFVHSMCIVDDVQLETIKHKFMKPIIIK